ncbi:N-acetylmuramoyl-L-alanine amidase [Microcoleus sp. FACHB-831]|uniref:N-acetylmuramoyl-L-alanine amidase n=1 Tax=Microcoleus sp. FACHB-831 TaxID=2692827 RepID=UPI001681C3CF|nr:N-acetylmuramoyl-L-alanine amidase [Microcoleus sp. FACHB-831]MBD1924315.1 N-acetylmuramoyl-L-alanine amidase [Microcoleus sp. FACHB-831]
MEAFSLPNFRLHARKIEDSAIEELIVGKLVKELDITDCKIGTSAVNGLSEQIIAQMNLLVPNVLVSFEELDVKFNGSAVYAFLQPAATEAIERAISDRGKTLLLNSAYRTVAQQYILRRQFEEGLCNIPAAALPGLSNHEGGLALDIEDADGWEPFLEKYGWNRLGRDFDPAHYDFVAAGRKDLGSIGVKAFQRLWNKNNPNDPIAEDGDFGPATRTRLENSPVDGFEKADSPQKLKNSSPEDSFEKANFSRVLRLTNPYMEGDDVKELQKALGIQADGVFGRNTQQAVKNFQNKAGLAVDGVVGPATRKALGLDEDEKPQIPARVGFKDIPLNLQTQNIFTLGGQADGYDDGDELILIVDKKYQIARPQVKGEKWQAPVLFNQAGKRLVEIKGSEQDRAQTVLDIKAGNLDFPLLPRSVWTDEPTPSQVVALTPKRITIHHTEIKNLSSSAFQSQEIQRLRDIRDFHIRNNKWDDIGYHFVIMPSGRVYEARSEGKRGAHDFVNDGLGIAFDGSFSTRKITDAQFKSAVALCTMLCERYGIDDPVTPVPTPTHDFGTKDLPRICCHRDRVQTSCPGSQGGTTVRLAEIRQAVKARLA